MNMFLPMLATLTPPLGGLGIAAIGVAVVAALLLGWYVGTQATEVRYATLADGQRQKRSLPMSFRWMLPFTPNLKGFHKARYQRARTHIEGKLTSAGYDTVLTAQEFLALRVLLPFALAPTLIVFMFLVTSQISGPLGETLRGRQGILFLLLFAYLALRPSTWLKKTIKTRHQEIERGLPFVLDLLTLSVEAGLDFMTSIRRLIERRNMDALSEELIRAIREMQVGRTRRDALRDMAHRVQQPDLSSVVSALVQADELGVGIGAILRIQAEQMRTRRFQRAEKMANEAPVKLLFPLTCFIFPCVFLVLLGPIFLEMMKTGF